MRLFCCFVILFTIIELTIQNSTRDSSTYIGGVIQSNPMTLKHPDARRREIFAKHYNSMVKIARQRNLDIIIFPEHQLTINSKWKVLQDKPASFVKYNKTDNNKDYVKKVEEFSKRYRLFCRDDAIVLPSNYNGEVICKQNIETDNVNSNMTALEILSCSARNNSMYLVASHYERVNCYFNPRDCPSDGFHLYSTSLVFDRQGRLIARYRKHTKFDEPWIDVPAHPEPVIFKTDFNVTFGLLIGLDVYEQGIIYVYAEDDEVTDVVLATSEPELPFFITTYDQVEYAREADVNLLVAGFGWDDSGSSIYTGLNEPIRKLATPKLPSSLIFKNITKRNNKKSSHINLIINISNIENDDLDFVPIFEGQDPQLELMPGNWTLSDFADNNKLAIYRLNPTDLKKDKTLCSNGLCCYYSLRWSHNYNHRIDKAFYFYTYAMIAVRGVYKLMNGTVVSIELCGLIACTKNSINTCGKRIDSNKPVIHPMKFNSIKIIRHNFKTIPPVVYSSPLALKFNGLIKSENFEYTHGSDEDFELTLKNPIDKLLIFAINTRIFDFDKLPDDYFKSKSYSLYDNIMSNSGYYILGVFVAAFIISIIIVCCVIKRMDAFNTSSLKDNISNKSFDIWRYNPKIDVDKKEDHRVRFKPPDNISDNIVQVTSNECITTAVIEHSNKNQESSDDDQVHATSNEVITTAVVEHSSENRKLSDDHPEDAAHPRKNLSAGGSEIDDNAKLVCSKSAVSISVSAPDEILTCDPVDKEIEVAFEDTGNEPLSRLSTDNPTTDSLSITCVSPASSSLADDQTDISESLPLSSSLAESVTLTFPSLSKSDAPITSSDMQESSQIESSYFQTGYRSGGGESTDADVDTIYSSDQGLIGSDSVLTSSGTEQQVGNAQGNEENANEGDNLVAIAGKSIDVSEGVNVGEAVDGNKRRDNEQSTLL